MGKRTKIVKKKARIQIETDEHNEDNEIRNEDNPQALENNQVQTKPENRNAEIQNNSQAVEDNVVQSEGNSRGEMDSERHNQDDNAKLNAKRKPRGPTKVRRLPFNSLERVEVEFNGVGEPIGEGSIKLSSYLGPLVREVVPVTVNDWRLLTDELKSVLWESIQARFKLDADWHRISIFHQMGVIWRASKCRLVRQLVNAKSMEERLRLKPDNIKCMNEWKKFVKLKTSSEFKVLSEKNRAIRRKQLPHTCSRKGMARLAEDLKKQSSDSSTVSRSAVWIKSRIKKNGEPVNMIAAEAISGTGNIECKCKIFDWGGSKELVAVGRLHSSISEEIVNDVPLGPSAMIVWIDDPQNPDAFLWRPSLGMTRIADAVGKKVAWPESQVIVEKASASAMPVTTMQTFMTANSRINNRCKLMDLSGKGKVVALGRVESTNPNARVHFKPLGNNAVSVWVDIVKEPTEELWRQTSELQYMEDALCSIIAWPAAHVIME